MGSWSEDTKSIYEDIACLLIAKSDLKQRISIAIQRGNAACVLGTVPQSSKLVN